jgi:hypothetical protein
MIKDAAAVEYNPDWHHLYADFAAATSTAIVTFP